MLCDICQDPEKWLNFFNVNNIFNKGMCLHAFRYSTDEWCFQSELPQWAAKADLFL